MTRRIMLVTLSAIVLFYLLPFLRVHMNAGENESVKRIPLLPPTPGKNPRNSEGAFIQLKDGRVMFVYTHFTGGAGDASPSHLAARFSSDGGLSWTNKDVLVLPNQGKMNTMSVSLLRLKTGEIAMFYLVRHAWDDLRMFMRKSTDEAKTWGEPVLCTPPQAYYVVNNDRVMQLSTGRLLIPAARHNLPGGKWSSHGVAMCFLSDDNGKTWQRSTSIIKGPEKSRTGLQEPGVVELKNGKLMMWSRTDQGSQYACYSDDHGDTWSDAKPSNIKSPVSPASIKRIPKTGDLMMVWNDHSNIDAKYRGKRTPFHVAISKDEGKSWINVKTLEDRVDGWYCYTAIAFVKNRVLLGHCAGDAKVGRLNRTQITVFPVDFLYRK